MTDSASSQRPVALVTGGGRGIGAAIALALARNGYDLAIADIADAAAAARVLLRTGARVHAVRCDLAETGDHDRVVQDVLDWSGRGIACLVNNAGVPAPRRGDLLDLRPESYDQVLDVNLRGTFFFTQRVARHMLAAPVGTSRSIVTISSASAELASIERGEYCISKAGLGMLTRLYALRLAPAGIAVFEVRPGIIQTAMTAGVAERYERLIGDGLVPMRRWGAPEDIASVVGALVSGKLAFATGSVVHVDGGLSIPRL